MTARCSSYRPKEPGRVKRIRCQKTPGHRGCHTARVHRGDQHQWIIVDWR